MKLFSLKRIRVIVSVIFLSLTSLVFLDYRNLLPEDWINTIVYLQFIPSLLKFINIFSLGILGFIVVLVLTLLFGRIYCSTICPLGILQDVISFISRKFKKKKKRFYRYLKPSNLLRYSLLGITTVLFLFGSILLVNLLDPYSNFGRFMTYFVKPVVVVLNNGLSIVLEKFNIYTIYPVELRKIQIEILLFPFFFLVLILWLSITNGRLFCNTVCPVGTLLGLISRFSLYKIRIEKSTCTICGLCDRVCKSSCMDYKEGKVDFTRCVSCYNCLTVCPSDSVKYSYSIGKWSIRQQDSVTVKHDTSPDLNKRKFIAGSVAWLLGIAGMSLAKETTVNEKPTRIPEEKEFPVSPPGSVSIRNYTDNCTACSLCINACPTKVLQPSFLQYGITGIMQPHMDYHSGFCNYDCIICSQICPTGAILPITLEVKQLTQLGKSVFVRENCVVYNDKTDCGACSEVCPTKAVYMVPYEGNLLIPEVKNDICVGCGACEFACPTTPYKAIYVDGNPVHLAAEKPEEEELKTPAIEEDFPF
jgi:ferredoxin